MLSMSSAEGRLSLQHPLLLTTIGKRSVQSIVKAR